MRRIATAVVAVVVLAGACGGDGEDSSRETTSSTTTKRRVPARVVTTTSTVPEPEPFTSLVAEAVSVPLAVYEHPDAPSAAFALPRPNPSNGPLVLLVQSRRADWLEVLLPLRPNGSTGWVRSGDVRVSTHDWRIVVELGAHRLTVTRRDEVVHQEPVAIGRTQAPTPPGLYYVNQLVRPGNPRGAYGPVILGLSGFSEVLETFAGALPALAIHGTNRPDQIGRDVSSGCIRMTNAGVTKLAEMLPLGVPVEVKA